MNGLKRQAVFDPLGFSALINKEVVESFRMQKLGCLPSRFRFVILGKDNDLLAGTADVASPDVWVFQAVDRDVDCRPRVQSLVGRLRGNIQENGLLADVEFFADDL